MSLPASPEEELAPDRMFRGACPHGTYWALLHGTAARTGHTTASCPVCGIVELSTIDP